MITNNVNFHLGYIDYLSKWLPPLSMHNSACLKRDGCFNGVS